MLARLRRQYKLEPTLGESPVFASNGSCLDVAKQLRIHVLLTLST